MSTQSFCTWRPPVAMHYPKMSTSLHLVIILIICIVKSGYTNVCEKFDTSGNMMDECGIQQHFSRKRYILYDVNPPEGFNLRRDVYVRVAVFINYLVENDKEYDWILVLPPWGNLYHWRIKEKGTYNQIPWGTFFDIVSLQRYVPVIEMYKFFEEHGSENNTVPIDQVYFLQNDEEMFRTGKFEDKNIITKCNEKLYYKKLNGHNYRGLFWGYSNITAKDVQCIIFHGTMLNLQQNLKPTLHRAVMFDHMEIPLHDFYGSQNYWEARRSMRYNTKLYNIANKFREKYLNSTDEHDNINRPIDWRNEKAGRDAIGGPYLSVHLRRRDFLIGHAKSVPTIQNAALQLRKKMIEFGLEIMFVATDADFHEFEELKTYLSEYKIFKFISDYKNKQFKDGELAIIDQIICSHARYFIGTHESTFTFRIQEDREIMGFPTHTTFNRLCKTKEKCKSHGQWEIVW